MGTYGQDSSAEQSFLAHQQLIDRTIAFVCRRNHLNAGAAEDFASDVEAERRARSLAEP